MSNSGISPEQMVKLGQFLRKKRLEAGHSQADVAAAIDRGFQYVSEVERGRRGYRMNPLDAITWAQFLGIEPILVLRQLNLDDKNGRLHKAVEYLTQVMWASNFLRSQEKVRTAVRKIDKVLKRSPNPIDGDDLKDAKTALQDTLALLSTPETGRKAR